MKRQASLVLQGHVGEHLCSAYLDDVTAYHDALKPPRRKRYTSVVCKILTVLGDKGGVTGVPKCNTGRIITSLGEIGVFAPKP